MISALRKCFPDAYIAVLVRRYTGDIVGGNPDVNELLWYDGEDGLVPMKDIAATLRERHFDAAIVVYPRFRLAWLMWRAGIPIRIGTGYRFYSFLFNRKVFEHRKDAQRHELEYNLRLLEELDCECEIGSSPNFFIEVPSDAHNRIEKLLDEAGISKGESFIIIHPGSGGSAREWSPRNFGLLAAKLIEKRGVKALVTGGRGDEAKVAEVVHASGGRAIPIVNQVSLKEFAALIRRSQLFVANSTGPLHLAVAMKTPVVGLYPQHTAMSAKRWGPYTDKKVVFVPERPLDCNVCVENNSACECMATISVDEVFEGGVDLLERFPREHKNVNTVER